MCANLSKWTDFGALTIIPQHRHVVAYLKPRAQSCGGIAIDYNTYDNPKNMQPSLGYVAVFWLCRVPPPTQMLILEGAPPWRPYGRNFDLAIGLGSIVAYEVEYGP